MVASYSINTFGMESSRSRQIWREIVSGTYEIDEADTVNCGYRINAKLYLTEELLFSTLTAEANAVQRTRAIIESRPSPLLKVRLYSFGNSRIQFDDEIFTLGRDAIHFIDHNRPSREIHSDHKQSSIFIPHHTINYDPSLHPATFSLALDSAPGRLLEASLKAAFRELDQLDASEAPAFVKSISGTLRGSMLGAVDSEVDNDIRKSRRLAIWRFIDQHLDEGSLDADRLQKVFHLSRATLFRDFADVGGVNRYILNRRMQRAYRELSEALPKRGVVQRVAERWGFTSLAHFSRLFREHHGFAPTSIVGQWAVEARSPTAGDNCHDGMEVDGESIAALQWSYGRFS